MTKADADIADPPWERCREPDCNAARVTADACLVHVRGDERAAVLASIGRGRPLDARGVAFDRALADEILAAVARDECGRPVLNRARFDRATFDPDVGFGGVVFAKEVSFDRARFEGDATFDGARFDGNARFARASFGGRAGFTDTAFAGQAWFGGATFSGLASFDRSEFSNMAWFGRADFATDAEFNATRFAGDTTFDGAAFGCHTVFADTAFLGELRLERATFTHDPYYGGAAFEGKGGAPQAAVRQAVWTGAALATWNSRAIARLVDDGILAAIVAGSAVVGLALEVVLQYGGALVLFTCLGAAAALALLIRELVEQGHTGQTRGKRRMGICLVRQRDGLPVGPRQSVMRHLLHVLDSLPLFLGWFRPLWDDKHQTIADTIATTVVARRKGWARVGATERAAAEAAAEPPPSGG